MWATIRLYTLHMLLAFLEIVFVLAIRFTCSSSFWSHLNVILGILANKNSSTRLMSNTPIQMYEKLLKLDPSNVEEEIPDVFFFTE